MSGTDYSSVSGLLKNVYDERAIEDLQNKEVVTWKKIKKAPQKPVGNGFYTPALVKGNQRGQGSQNELEALRTPATQTVLQFIISPKIFTHTIRLSGLSIEMARGNEASFANNLTFQMEEGLKDAAKELNAQVFRSGLGRLAQVNGAVSASTSLVFDNGVPTHLKRGMFIDVYNGSTREIDSIEITDVNPATNTATLASAQTCSDNAYVYRENTNDNAPTGGKELSGLPLVTDNGTISATYQGLSRSTYPILSGISIDGGGANVSNDMLQRAISRVKILSNGKMPNKVISNTSQMRKYLDIVTPLKRFQSKDKMDSGYEEVPTWNTLEWVEDTDCQFDTIYMISTDYLEKYEVYPLKFDDTDGKILYKDPGFDAFVAYAKYYGNIGTRTPNAHVAITNLATPSF